MSCVCESYWYISLYCGFSLLQGQICGLFLSPLHHTLYPTSLITLHHILSLLHHIVHHTTLPMPHYTLPLSHHTTVPPQSMLSFSTPPPPLTPEIHQTSPVFTGGNRATPPTHPPHTDPWKTLQKVPVSHLPLITMHFSGTSLATTTRVTMTLKLKRKITKPMR